VIDVLSISNPEQFPTVRLHVTGLNHARNAFFFSIPHGFSISKEGNLMGRRSSGTLRNCECDF
jgi:hypothetical protein